MDPAMEHITVTGVVMKHKPIPRNQQVFTSGQAARFCTVAARTLSKWIDAGKIPGAYRIPDSKDRRIPRKALIRFLKENGMPLGDLLEEELRHVLLIGCLAGLAVHLEESLPADQGYRFRVAVDGFAAGTMLGSVPAPVVVIDLSMGRSEALTIAARLRANPDYAEATMVAVTGEDEADHEGLSSAGFCNAFRRPFDAWLLALVIREAFEES